jgi:hypothetical protein
VGEDGQFTGTVQAAARIGAALMNGPLTVHGACLIAGNVTDREWKRLLPYQKDKVRSQVYHILNCIESVDGRLLTEDKQGSVTIFFLVQTA